MTTTATPVNVSDRHKGVRGQTPGSPWLAAIPGLSALHTGRKNP